MDVISKTPYISVCIPTYEMNGQGHGYLRKSLEVLCTQSFKDFNVIVSDNSKDQVIEKLCQEFKDALSIIYIKNLHKFGISANLNNAISNSNGKILKILFQDDYLYSESSLADIANKFNLITDYWMVTACEHSSDGVRCYRKFTPRFSKSLLLGVNTISSPSVLTIKNSSSKLMFDENLTWLMDCDYYYQSYLAFGYPAIIYDVNVVNRTGSHQATNLLVNRKMKSSEFKYIRKKYSAYLTLLDKFVLFIKNFY
jgi:glycosyltransferase involved in cell wall biosynthesis